MIKTVIDISMRRYAKNIVLTMLLATGLTLSGRGQFVNVDLTVLPEQFSVIYEETKSKEFWGIGNIDSTATTIGITARENTSLYVKVEYNHEASSPSWPIKAWWIDNGAEPIFIYQKSALFHLDYRPLLIDEIPGAPNRLTAWIYLTHQEDGDKPERKLRDKPIFIRITYL